MTIWKKFIIKTAIVTCLAVLLNYSILPGLIDLSAVLTQKNTEGFHISDFYNRVAYYYAPKQINENVVCINFESESRDSLALLLNLIAEEYKPAAVGVDFYFPVEGDNDKLLISALRRFGDKLVMPQLVCSYIDEETGDEIFVEDYSSYLNDSLPDSHFGVINLETNYNLEVVRDFMPYFPTIMGDTLLNFAVQLSKIARPQSIDLMNQQSFNCEVLTINFPFALLDTISTAEIFDAASDWHEMIDGRVLIIGSNTELKDIYQTSLPDPIAGLQIHAYTVNTIMSGSYIKNSSDSFMIWFSIFVVVIIILLNCWANEYAGSAGNSLIRIVQFIVIIICLIAGYAMFYHYSYSIDFSYCITLIVMSMLAYDIVGVLEWGYVACMKKLKYKNNK